MPLAATGWKKARGGASHHPTPESLLVLSHPRQCASVTLPSLYQEQPVQQGCTPRDSAINVSFPISYQQSEYKDKAAELTDLVSIHNDQLYGCTQTLLP